jgi:hypothetical protein
MDNSIRPRYYKVVLLLIKFIPMLIALCYGANSLLAYFDKQLDILGYLVSYLFIILLYLLSYVFRFCAYHRMFIHYILSIDILNTIDYYIGLPLGDFGIWCLYAITTCIAIFITLYLYVKQNKTHKGVVRGRDR